MTSRPFIIAFILLLLLASSAIAQKIIVTDTLYEFPDTKTGNGEYGYITVRTVVSGSHNATLSVDDSNFVLPSGTQMTWTGLTGYAQIGFKPKTSGKHDCILTIAGDSNSKQVHLTGVGIYQHAVGVEGTLVDTIPLGTQSCSAFTFYAPMGDPATILSIEAIPVGGAEANFTFGLKSGTWVKWDDSVIFNVCVQGTNEIGVSENLIRIIYHDSLKKWDSVDVMTSFYISAPRVSNCLAFLQADSTATIDLGATTGGGTYRADVFLMPFDSAAFQLDSVRLSGGDSSRFAIKSHPSSIAGLQTDSLQVEFNAPYPFSKNRFRTALMLQGRSTGFCFDTAFLVATILDSTADTKLAALANSGDTVSVTGDVGRNFYRFIWTNTTGNRVSLSNVRVQSLNSGDFALLTHYSRPGGDDTVEIGGEYIVNVGLDASSKGLYDATLGFTMANALQNQTYHITANVGNLSVASSSEVNVKLQADIQGNTYTFSVAGATRAEYRLFDILGRELQLNNDSWNFETAPAGVYFIHASAKGTDGNLIERTRRLIVAR
jgi:hypothetical protein